MAPISGFLRQNFQLYQVFGANTNVGKTIFSTIICRVAKQTQKHERVWYLKPVSTGPLEEADNRHLSRYAPGVVTQNLFQFDDPVSPHVAARRVGQSLSDATVLEAASSQIAQNAAHGDGFMLVETAGGPNSPGPSGTLQTDLYRPLRFPIILIADWNLGGISTSVSAFESLRLRGYDIEGVACMRDSYYQNADYLSEYFSDREIPFFTAPVPPEPSANDEATMNDYYNSMDGPAEGHSKVPAFLDSLTASHHERVLNLETMSLKGFKNIWWPFTQHQQISPKDIATIDSAYGDYFQTLRRPEATPPSSLTNLSQLQASFDGSASWWTQGLGHANPELTMAAAYAAGRYGHVMFASAINEPALSLASNLLATVAHPRLSRVFYSDNGSTGMEVAVKMALKASCARYGWDIAAEGQRLEILGLTNSYHGDTIGSMDLSEPSVFNQQIHWYKGRGHWFDVPSVKMRNGSWVIEKPATLGSDQSHESTFEDLQQVFSPSRDSSDEAKAYEDYIRTTLKRLTQEGRRFGALVMEPVVLGAGGMLLVDPLFQRTLVKVVRESADIFCPTAKAATTQSSEKTWTGLPIVADEVFTGLFRLGHASSSALLGIEPDVAVYAKLLTGGLVPLSCTLASESIFEAFLADGKSDALLHGHSYTAHAVGCTVANKSLEILNKLHTDGSWDAFRRDWNAGASASSTIVEEVNSLAQSVLGKRTPDTKTPQVWSVWSQLFLTNLSHRSKRVDSVWALGSVLSISLKDAEGAGYSSNVAKDLQKQLLDNGGRDWNIHSRVLGNVLYLMTGQTSRLEDVRALEGVVSEALS